MGKPFCRFHLSDIGCQLSVPFSHRRPQTNRHQQSDLFRCHRASRSTTGVLQHQRSFYRCAFQLELDGIFSLQQTDKSDYVHLPLFLAKLKVAYSQPIFHKAATLQPSLSVQYFTKYHADAYMPAIRTFYLQNEVMIGNFPFLVHQSETRQHFRRIQQHVPAHTELRLIHCSALSHA